MTTTLRSQRVSSVKPSPTLAITAQAAELRLAGRDVIGLGAGEPDFDTPEHIKQAAIEAIRNGFTKYTPVGGIPELKDAIIARMDQDHHGVRYERSEVIVTVGGKQAFYNLAQATLDPGDEVIIPAPYWVSYPDMTLLAGGVPVVVTTAGADRFKITPEALERAITKRTRFLVINSPSNPTGSAYTAEELAALGEVLMRHPQVYLISDDIYEKIVFDDFQSRSMVQIVPELKYRMITLNGVSKTYAMTGWRIGYAVGPAEIIRAMSVIQSQSTSNATSISQKAAVAALSGPQDCVQTMLTAFVERRDFVVTQLNAIEGVQCQNPEGAFYVYPNVGGLINRTTPDNALLENSNDLAAYLLSAQNVAVVPGSAFGKDPYLRISYATSMTQLKEAMARIHEAVKLLN